MAKFLLSPAACEPLFVKEPPRNHRDRGRKPVRRQSFWDRRRLKLRESLAPLVCNIMRLADGAASGDWRLSVV